MGEHKTEKNMDRRSFLRSTAAVGAGLVLSPMVYGSESGKGDDINVALIGAGNQGQVLIDACLKIPGVRFKAVCDIWENYNLKKVSRRLSAYHHENNAYVDYHEMLDAEKDLDAVIVATPDFWHAEHAIACMKAGLHVYCEKEMSNTLEGARQIVLTAKQTGKLLQIGHQRRSNPRYLHCYDKLLKEAKILGRITAINGQWNCSKSAGEPLGAPEKYTIDQGTLEKYGFESMHQFRNWRWFKSMGGGPIADLGSHQIDIYNWFLEASPKSVIAGGSSDYWPGRQWYDNVMAIYEYATDAGPVRAFYETIITNSSQGYYESFLGDEATLVISESAGRGAVYREPSAPDWAKWVKLGLIDEPPKVEKPKPKPGVIDVRETMAPPAYKLSVKTDKLYHQPHLENFFDAIRGKAKLNCPGEIGYETAATVLKVNEAVEAARKLDFTTAEFKV